MALQIGCSLQQLTPRQYLRFCGYALGDTALKQTEIANFLSVHPDTVGNWQERYNNTEQLDLCDAPRSGRKPIYDSSIQSRFIAFYCQTTSMSEFGRWTLRTAAKQLKETPGPVGQSISRATMQRILARHQLKPHRTGYFLHITDPDFFPKMERIIKLYKSPPKNLYSFDECPGIQVLQRIAPNMWPNGETSHSWLEEFEYIRNGTLDLFAFLEVKSGQVYAQVRSNHTITTFIEVFRGHVNQAPQEERLDYVMDNLDSHCSYPFCKTVAQLSKTDCPGEKELNNAHKRREWLQREDKRIVIHFTPFHGSWLNMVEIFFRILKKGCLEDSYSSPDQLRESILEYVTLWNDQLAHPFDWKYEGVGLEQKAVLRFTTMLRSSAGNMTLQFFTKSFKLMMNLMKDYKESVESSIWEKLFVTIRETETILRERIAQSEQPKVKIKAEQTLRKIIEAIKVFNQNENTPETKN